MKEKRDVIKYLIISLVFVGLVGFLVVFSGGPTGFVIYTDIGGGQTVLTSQEADNDNLGDSYVISGNPDAPLQGSAGPLRTWLESLPSSM